MGYVWVALGSALGGMARYGVSQWMVSRPGSIPWATLIINFSGSFIIGFTAACLTTDSRIILPANTRVFFMVGVLGGFTTFSAFSLQTLELMQQGAWVAAVFNVLISVMGCLLAVWLGYAAGRFVA